MDQQLRELLIQINKLTKKVNDIEIENLSLREEIESLKLEIANLKS